MVRYERYFYDPELIAAILNQCDIVSVGFQDKNNAYVVPMNYGYSVTKDKLLLYLHTGKTGYKLKLIEKNPRVCCSFYVWQNFPDNPYRGRVHDFMSVMAFGKIRELDIKTEKEHFKEGLQTLLKKNNRSGCKNPKGMAAINIYVIECNWKDVSGKSEHPIRKPEDAVFKDVHLLPKNNMPYDDSDLYALRKDCIRESEYLGYITECEN